MEAKVFTSGNLGNYAKAINFENGNVVITFSIATNNYFTNRNSEQIQLTTWHDCKKFVKNVNEKFIDKLAKGATVTILGVPPYYTSFLL